MTNGTTKTNEVKTQPVDSKPAPTPEVKPGNGNASQATQSAEVKTPTAEPVKPVEPASDVKPGATPSEPVVSAESEITLTREFFALLGQTVRNAENKVKNTKIGGVNGYSSVNQSDAIAIVRGEKSIVVRKFQGIKETTKDSDGNVIQLSEYNEKGELTEAGLDRQATIKQYMEWYYSPPINDSEYEDSEEKTLVENGAILNAVNLVYKATLTGGTADSLAGVFILQSIEAWEESYFLMFDYAIRSVVIDGISMAGSNLIDLINYAHCRYDIIDSTYGFSVDTEVSAKSDGTPRKRSRASVAGMINTEKTPSPKSESKDKGLGDRTPTGKEFNPAENLNAARDVANAVNAKENAVNGTPSAPPLVKSEGEHNGVKVESTPSAEKPAEIKTDAK